MKRTLLTGAFSLIVLGFMSTEKVDAAEVAVVGGGLTGLLEAYNQKQEGHSVTIYEATSEVGGKAKNPVGFKSWKDYPKYMALAKKFKCKLDENKRPTKEQITCLMSGLTEGIKVKTGYKLIGSDGKTLTFKTPRGEQTISHEEAKMALPSAALEEVEHQ